MPLEIGFALLGGLLICKLYHKLNPEFKRKWENKIKSHHGAWGMCGLVSGVLTFNFTWIGCGLALMIDDWKDRHEWFDRKKRIFTSRYSILALFLLIFIA